MTRRPCTRLCGFTSEEIDGYLNEEVEGRKVLHEEENRFIGLISHFFQRFELEKGLHLIEHAIDTMKTPPSIYLFCNVIRTIPNTPEGRSLAMMMMHDLLYSSRLEKNRETFNVLLIAFSSKKNRKFVHDCFRHMEVAGIIPDDVAYSNLISVCTFPHDMHLVLNTLETIRGQGSEPSFSTYLNFMRICIDADMEDLAVLASEELEKSGIGEPVDDAHGSSEGFPDIIDPMAESDLDESDDESGQDVLI